MPDEIPPSPPPPPPPAEVVILSDSEGPASPPETPDQRPPAPAAEVVILSDSEGPASLPKTPDRSPQASFTLQPQTPPEPKKPTQRPAPEEASQSPFTVTVGQVYDGPLDLLLDLIRKQNIDIYDIPIARITAQFLEYTHHLKQMDVDTAGEFIYMASLLIHIKSKTLLPRDPTDVLGGPDSEDPRRELVERLLEHERFKAAAQMLLQKQQIEDATWTHPGLPGFLRDLQAAADPSRDSSQLLDMEQEIAADTVDLVRAFGETLARLRARPVLDVDEDSVTVAQMIDFTKRRLLMEDRPISLRKLLGNTHTERAVICMFLAMLELVRLQAILLHQPILGGDILIKKSEAFDQIFEDQGNARDDWR